MTAKRYKVRMWVEAGGEPEDDPHVSKIVTAKDKHTALDAARRKARDENPKLNYRKIWAWTVRRLY